MADVLTPNWGYTLPTVGLDRDTWGAILNANWTKVDGDLATVNANLVTVNDFVQALVANIVAYVEPIGSIKPWPNPSQPSGWLPCDGWVIPRSQFPELFGVIGTLWGAGDGSTTFNLPNFQGCTLVHRNGGWMPFGGVVGEANHTLSWEEMPVHVHGGTTDGVGDHSHSYTLFGLTGGSGLDAGGVVHGQNSTEQTGAAGGHAHTFTTSGAGSGAAHNNVQPSVGVLWIIKASHVGL